MTPETQSAHQVGNLCDAPAHNLGSYLSFGIGDEDGRPQQNIDVIKEIPARVELGSVN